MAAGKSLLGQAPLGKPMYGGGYINGAQQVFSGNRPSNAFGGLGCGNPLAGLGWFFNYTSSARRLCPPNSAAHLASRARRSVSNACAPSPASDHSVADILRIIAGGRQQRDRNAGRLAIGR